ncbi:MAG: ABC transporter ATP-binding protein [Bacteroidales bacterium]
MKTDNSIFLKLSDLVVGYHGKALMPPVNASIKRGELVSVVGHNGIGKSTLLRTLAGVSERLSGGIAIDNDDIKDIDIKELARRVGYISTDIVNVPNMTVFDLIATGRYSYTNWFGAITETDRQIIYRSAKLTGITHLIDRFLNELSDGERQRSMIARVLAQDTDLLIMDEPAAFLDIRNRHEIMNLLHQLTRAATKTIVMSTHDLQSAMGESDVIWVLTGDGLTVGAPEDLVLQGAFEAIFSCDTVKFKKSDGNFYPVREVRGEASVTGTGLMAQWTIKALTRAGYRFRNVSSADGVNVVCDESGNSWRVSYMGECNSFSSLYDLSEFLRRAE